MIWRDTDPGASVSAAEVAFDSGSTWDLTPRLFSIDGTPFEVETGRVVNIGSRFDETYAARIEWATFTMRLYDARGGDELHDKFAYTGTRIGGWLCLLDDVPEGAADAEGSRVDVHPVWTFGLQKDRAADNVAASYTIRFVPAGEPRLGLVVTS